MGRSDRTIQEFRQAADLGWDDIASMFLIGYTYDLMGRWGEAVEAYEKVAGVTASNANALRDANKQTRRGAKNAVRANASVNASEDGSALTDNEVLSKLQGLGFE